MEEHEVSTSEERSTESDFVMVYEDGQPVDPSAEFSELLAMHVAELARNGEPVTEAEATAMEAQCSEDLWVTFHAAIEGCLTAAEKREEEEKEGDHALDVAEEQEEGEDHADTPDATLSEMQAEGMSRTFSDNEDAWVLEAILADRLTKQQPPTAGEDKYNVVEECDGKRVTVASKGARERQFLCKWKWYQEPTWESESLLEEEGFGEAIKVYLKSSVSAKGKGPKHGGPKAPGLTQVSRERSQADSDTLSLARSLFQNLRKSVVDKFAEVHRTVQAVVDVAQPDLVRRFLSAWRGKGKGAVPVLLFHGTRGCNIPSIVDRGFIIPGRSGVRIVNGNAFGDGVYSATTPSVPAGYCDDRRVLFVCVGLVGGGTGTKAVNEYRIFTNEKCIIPLWAVHFSTIKRGFDSNVDDRSEPQEWSMARLAAHLSRTPSAYNVPSLNRQPDGVSSRVVERVSRASGNRSAKGGEPEADRIPVMMPGTFAESIRHGVTKKMLKKAPRSLKEYYAAGLLRNRKSTS